MLVAGIFLVLAAAIAWAFISSYSGGRESELQVMTQAAFEEETGVHVNLIGVVGGGGLINVRIKVLDTEKATRLFHDPDITFFLIAEDSDITLLPPDDMEYAADFEADRAYNVLFANTENAIKSGSLVTVVIGDFQLEHVIAQ